MRLLAMFVVLALSPVAAQEGREKPPDSSSSRVSIRGCLKGRSLVAIEALEGEPINVNILPGRVFRLSGSKRVMNELKKRDRSAVELTGLVRKSSLAAAPQGMPIAGGRIRIGGMPMNRDPTKTDPQRDPLSNVDVFDVESFRPIDASCHAR